MQEGAARTRKAEEPGCVCVCGVGWGGVGGELGERLHRRSGGSGCTAPAVMRGDGQPRACRRTAG